MSNTSVAIKPVVQPGRFSVKKYNVIIHNDDKTTFDFVMEVLQAVFAYDYLESAKLARTIHLDGLAIVGTYTKEIAEEKVSAAVTMSVAANFQLQIEYVESDQE